MARPSALAAALSLSAIVSKHRTLVGCAIAEEILQQPPDHFGPLPARTPADLANRQRRNFHAAAARLVFHFIFPHSCSSQCFLFTLLYTQKKLIIPNA